MGKQLKFASFSVAPYLTLKLFQYIDLQVDYREVPNRSQVPNGTSDTPTPHERGPSRQLDERFCLDENRSCSSRTEGQRSA